MSYRPITDFWILARYATALTYPGGFLHHARAPLGVGPDDPVLHVCGVVDHVGQATRHSSQAPWTLPECGRPLATPMPSCAAIPSRVMPSPASARTSSASNNLLALLPAG